MTEFRIRPIERSHIAVLIQLGEETGLSPWSAQNYLDELRNPDSAMLRAENDQNETIGFIVGRLVTAADSETAVDGEIYNISVRPEAQRHGVGQKLLDEFLERCRSSRVRSVWLEVRESNQKALAFYRKNDFSPVHKRRSFYSDPPEDGLLMRRDL